MEIWKDIKGYEGLYKISNLGNVKSLPRATTKGKLLVKNLDSYGYEKVTLSKNGIHKQFSVHKLVATSFIENPYNLKSINHKDEVKTNNIVSNLEWCSEKYNVNYGSCIPKRSNRRKRAVLQFSKSGELIREWASAVDAEIALGISRKQISAVIHNLHKTAGGFVWRLK